MVQQLDMEQFIQKYCDSQEITPADFAAILKRQHDQFNPDGWMMLQCQDMSSSYMGSLTVLPYGPCNTFKEPPTGCISPRGLASDMSSVIAITDNILRTDEVPA